MLEIIEKIIIPCAFIAPILLVISNFILFRRNQNKNAVIIVSASASVLIFLGIMIIGTGLILRDGIGPDAVTSHGKMAWERSRSAILVGACLVFISLVAPPTLIWIKFKKREKSTNSVPLTFD